MNLFPPKTVWQHWAQEAVELLFPISCLNCGQEKNNWLCLDCAAALPFVISAHCPACGQPTGSGAACAACRVHSALDGAISFIPYADPLIQKLIQAWKYQGIRELSVVLGNFALAGLEIINNRLDKAKKQIYSGFSHSDIARTSLLPTLLLDKNTWLVSTPLYKRKLRQRGFNQAEDLAKIISAKNNW
ncbi:MAG: double zinc ribbon domain-containing protein, partial [Candidatus Komeilibacteria bacterium]|nr:double zinc ribbon domain-containing protein [Candidatus Komeilibacteria bacterium]